MILPVDFSASQFPFPIAEIEVVIQAVTNNKWHGIKLFEGMRS